ncbi:MAG: hypothetical protein ACTSVV_00505 [Promethearchaeota archaeon]
MNDSGKESQDKCVRYVKETMCFIKHSPETIQKLKAEGIRYKVIEFLTLEEEPTDIPDEDLPIVTLEKDLYFKLDQISQITTIPLEKIINTEIDQILRDYVRKNLFKFLDDYLGIKNIESPIEIAKKLKPILDLSEDDILELENVDPIEHVNRFKKLNF